MKATLTPTQAIALNNADGQVPDWIQLTPSGPHIQGRDGRSWTLSNPEAVVATFAMNRTDVPVDFEHATQVKGDKGEAAPAVGWIKGMEVRDGALWGQVEWNAEGRQAVSTKGYRYVSPVFTFKKGSGVVGKIMSAALTNQPNFEMQALNKEGNQEEPALDKPILEALGLAEGASTDDAVTAINKLKSDEETARNRADAPQDLTKFVPRADFDAAQNKIRDYEAAAEKGVETAINTAVDDAVKAGKVTPASRDYHIAACKAEGGLEAFEAFVEAAPVIAGNSGLDDKDATALNKTKLTDEEVAACRVLGMSHEDYLQGKADMETAT